MKKFDWQKPQVRSATFILFLIITLASLAIIKQLAILGQNNSKIVLSDSVVAVTEPINRPEKQTITKQYPQKAVSSNISVPILIYHYIGNNPNSGDTVRDRLSVTPDIFEKQMRYLNDNGYKTISLDVLNSASAYSNPSILPPKALVLTFDDGYIDFYYNAFPILEKYQMTATQFIPTGLVGKPAYLTWEMIKTMNKTGRIHFEAHGVNHFDLSSLNQNQLEYEIYDSKETLESQLGRQINYLAYPYGKYNQQVVNTARKAGYKMAFTTVRDFYNFKTDTLLVPRLRPPNFDNLNEFESILQFNHNKLTKVKSSS